MIRILFTLISAGVFGVAQPAIAAETYRGVLEDADGRLISVLLSIESKAKVGQHGGSIHFGLPWACGYDLEFSASLSGAETYLFKGAGLGPCSRYMRGHLLLTPSKDGAADLQLNGPETALKHLVLHREN